VTVSLFFLAGMGIWPGVAAGDRGGCSCWAEPGASNPLPVGARMSVTDFPKYIICCACGCCFSTLCELMSGNWMVFTECELDGECGYWMSAHRSSHMILYLRASERDRWAVLRLAPNRAQSSNPKRECAHTSIGDRRPKPRPAPAVQSGRDT
jgi:hypothetical protein